jgi:hypothetical protein
VRSGENDKQGWYQNQATAADDRIDETGQQRRE